MSLWLLNQAQNSWHSNIKVYTCSSQTVRHETMVFYFNFPKAPIDANVIQKSKIEDDGEMLKPSIKKVSFRITLNEINWYSLLY